MSTLTPIVSLGVPRLPTGKSTTCPIASRGSTRQTSVNQASATWSTSLQMESKEASSIYAIELQGKFAER